MTRPLGERPAAAMKLDRLRKVLWLEQRKGFTNTAVVGGLDRFLQLWAAEAHRSAPHPMIRSGLSRLGLLSPGYGALESDQRAQWVKKILDWTSGLDGKKSAAGTKAVPRPAVEPTEDQLLGAFAVKRQRQTSTSGPLLDAGQDLETSLDQVRGFSADLVRKLRKLAILTLRDLLYYFPRRHIDFSNTQPIRSLQIGQEQTAVGAVTHCDEVSFAGRRRAAQVTIQDHSGSIRAVWFNQPYIARTLRLGAQVVLSGRVGTYRGTKVFENPEHEFATGSELVHTGRLVPVYPLTAGLSSRRLRVLLKRIIDGALPHLDDFLPATQRVRLKLSELSSAVREAHFPKNETAKALARRRLAFDELFLIQLGVLSRKKSWKEHVAAHPLPADQVTLDKFRQSLPFVPTRAQERVTGEMLADLAKPNPMSRLIQGEVGSGKTMIAVLGMLIAVANGQQAAMMAPTEILAEQHFLTIQKLLSGLAEPAKKQLLPSLGPRATTDIVFFQAAKGQRPIAVGLLMGSTPRKRKLEIQEMAAHGEVDILVGTHALFQKDVAFSNLALAIVDEQHRFGVMQRSELRQKGYNPHLLVMTATPIPRSLALTVYGDLDVSTLDELPPGRQEIRTRWLDASQREMAYRFIRKEVAVGRQAFIVYPLVEESEALDIRSATAEHARLGSDVFPGLRLGLLHGRMKTTEKDHVMRAFREGKTEVLISTAVVEVGIDIPNATVMMVEDANRFGLAQLHQFRGRVGRGEHPSYCILVSETPSPEASERLGLLERMHDGFALAEEDLRLRGPGEFFGARQSGLPDLRMAQISDVQLVELARNEATALFGGTIPLADPERSALKAAVARSWEHRILTVGEA